jgi:hypothetical protein
MHQLVLDRKKEHNDQTASYAWFMQTSWWIVGDELISDAFSLFDSSQQQQVAPNV